MTTPMSLEEQVARLALDTFNSLPPKCKPRTDPKTRLREWVPMSAIVIVDHSTPSPTLHLATLATGSKCIPSSTLPLAQGLILHDSHSEILALRALNHLLFSEIQHLLTADLPTTSPFILRNPKYPHTPNAHPFLLSPHITIHLFSTEAPCGDASMEIIMSEQADATPWSSNPSSSSSEATTSLPGRSNFSDLAIIRRKPSRPDAPPTLSKSCTDKLTMKQFTSVLSGLTSLLIAPGRSGYISSFVVPSEKYNQEGYMRAFSREGRLSVVDVMNGCGDDGGYGFVPFDVAPLPEEFPMAELYRYSKPAPVQLEREGNEENDNGNIETEKWESKTSHISVVYINLSHRDSTIGHVKKKENTILLETLTGGVKQGNNQLGVSKNERKGSVLCRKKQWRLFRDVAGLLGDEELIEIAGRGSYAEMKQNNERRRIKGVVQKGLGGWIKNQGDDEWSL